MAEQNQLNLTVIALVALVAIVGLVALVLNVATPATGMQQAYASAPSDAQISDETLEEENLVGDVRRIPKDRPVIR